MEAIIENSKEALTKAEVYLAATRADLATTRTDLALEKQRREAEVMEAKRELVDAKKRDKEAVVKYKVSKDFATEMARAMANFCKSEKFFTIYQAFNWEAFKKGIDMGTFKYQDMIMDHYIGLGLTSLDEEGESKGQPSTATTEAPLVKVVPVLELVGVDLVAIPKPASSNPAIGLRPSSIEGIFAPSKDAAATINPMEKVED